MLHDRLLRSDASLPAHYHHNPRSTVSYQQCDSMTPTQLQVDHFGWPEHQRQRRDVIGSHNLSSQQPSSSGSAPSHVMVSHAQSQTDNAIARSSSRWPYVNWHLSSSCSDWLRGPLTPVVAVTDSSWSPAEQSPLDARLYPFSSFGPDIDQFCAGYATSTDSMVTAGCMEFDGRRSSAEMAPSELTSRDALRTAINNEDRLTISVASPSPVVCENEPRHQFGFRPTRASMSIGKTRTREKYRSVYNEQQKLQLERQYIAHTYISAEQKADIARDVGLTERQVKIWFQNRRAKDRRKKYLLSCNQDCRVLAQNDDQQQFACLQF